MAHKYWHRFGCAFKPTLDYVCGWYPGCVRLCILQCGSCWINHRLAPPPFTQDEPWVWSWLTNPVAKRSRGKLNSSVKRWSNRNPQDLLVATLEAAADDHLWCSQLTQTPGQAVLDAGSFCAGNQQPACAQIWEIFFPGNSPSIPASPTVVLWAGMTNLRSAVTGLY